MPHHPTILTFHLAGRRILTEVHRSEIQSIDSPTYSTKFVVDEPAFPTEGLILSSIGEQILGHELEVFSEEEEEEEESYFNIPLVEEPKEELYSPIIDSYISSEESTMVGEGEGDVHNVDGGEFRTRGGRGGGGNRGGGGGRGGGIDAREEPDPY